MPILQFLNQMIESVGELIQYMLMEIIMIWEHHSLAKLKLMSYNWLTKLKINSFLNIKQAKKLWIYKTKYPHIHQPFLTMSIFFLSSKCNGFCLK